MSLKSPIVKVVVVTVALVLGTIWAYNRFSKSGGVATLGVKPAGEK